MYSVLLCPKIETILGTTMSNQICVVRWYKMMNMACRATPSQVPMGWGTCLSNTTLDTESKIFDEKPRNHSSCIQTIKFLFPAQKMEVGNTIRHKKHVPDPHCKCVRNFIYEHDPRADLVDSAVTHVYLYCSIMAGYFSYFFQSEKKAFAFA